MLDVQFEYEVISEYINLTDSKTDVHICCDMLDHFWSHHCEVTKTFLFVITYTKSDSSAKKMWYDLRNKLNFKIRLIEDINENF